MSETVVDYILDGRTYRKAGFFTAGKDCKQPPCASVMA